MQFMAAKAVLPSPMSQEAEQRGSFHFDRAFDSAGQPRRNHLLVIGVDEYNDAKTWPKLNNAEYDAQAFAKLMTEKYSFSLLPQHQLIGKDATREEILEQFESFTAHGASKLTKADNLLVYFAGHGDIRGTRGFWIPRDASMRVGSLVSHDDIWGILRDIHAHHIYLIADACFAGDFVRRSGGEGSRFAANADLFPSRRVLASGRSGQKVNDGVPGQHSPFARVLLSFLNNSPEPEIPAEEMELHVKKIVPRLADKQQPISAYLHGLNDQEGQMVFRKEVIMEPPGIESTSEEASLPPIQPVLGTFTEKEEPLPIVASEKEEFEWEIARRVNTPEAFGHYLSLYPNGKYSHNAGQRLHNLSQKAWDQMPQTRAGMQDFQSRFPFHFLPLYQEATKRLAAIELKQWLSLQENPNPKELTEFIELNPQGKYADAARKMLEREEAILFEMAKRQKNPEIFLSSFSIEKYAQRSGIPLPDMIFIKGGTFEMGDVMGDNEHDREKPVHRVTVSDFYLGKYAVTFAEYDVFCEATGKKKPDDKGWGRADRPVINVSWEDAQGYCQWLKERTGQPWRLPTEAEWEYAAREGGKKVRFGNGKDIADPSEMNFDASENYKKPYSVVGEYRQQTVPVGSFSPNGLGLYNMSGNVWEWCEDDWHGNYSGAPADGRAWVDSPRGSNRVFRGGGWGNYPVGCRVAYRYGDGPGVRGYGLGFRLAR